MRKLYKYRAAIALVLLGFAGDYASKAQDKKDDAELAARKASAPVLNSNLAWLSK